MQDWIGSFRSVLPSQSDLVADPVVAICSARPYPMQIYAKVLHRAKNLRTIKHLEFCARFSLRPRKGINSVKFPPQLSPQCVDLIKAGTCSRPRFAVALQPPELGGNLPKGASRPITDASWWCQKPEGRTSPHHRSCCTANARRQAHAWYKGFNWVWILEYQRCHWSPNVMLAVSISSTQDKFTEFTLDPPFAPKVRGKKASILVAVDSRPSPACSFC